MKRQHRRFAPEALESRRLLTNNIFNIEFDPPSPAELDHLELINVSYDYETDSKEGVYIFARPLTNGEPSPNLLGHPSTLATEQEGPGSGFFTIETGDVVVDAVRLQMYDNELNNILFETIVDANYEFGFANIVDVDADWFSVLVNEPSITVLAADFNRDGSVGFGDFAILAQNFGRAGENVPGDSNNDGVVNFADFARLATTFGAKNNIESIGWNGVNSPVASGQWILQLRPETTKAGQPDQISVQAASDLLDDFGITVVKGLGRPGALLVRAEATDGEEAKVLFENGPAGTHVERYEPNVVMTPADFPNDPPNDPLFPTMWNLDRVDAPEAWTITTGSPQTIVAVIDSGIDYTHRDLDDNIWTSTAEIIGNGVDDDGSGQQDDIRGFNFIDGNADPMDTFTGTWHGSHVAGIVATEPNNSFDTIGVSPNVSLLPLKVFDSMGNGTTAELSSAIRYATQLRLNGEDVRVMNTSLSFGAFIGDVADAIQTAGDAGILLVTSAGNGGPDSIGDNIDVTPIFPASYPHSNIITVAATDATDALTGFSNFGTTSVDIAAPGQAIQSSIDADRTGVLSGTSQAAPHVSAAAALLWSVDPDATVAEVRDQILASADGVPSLSGRIATGGRLNVFDALEGWGGYQLRSHFYIPPRDGEGDTDFSGNGPEMEISVELRINPTNPTELQTRVQVDAFETGPSSDGTSASGPALASEGWETAYVAPDGQRVLRILSPTNSGIGFLDADHEANIVRMPLGDLVRHFEIVGDTDGEEAGIETGVRVHFRPVDLELSDPPPSGGLPCTIELAEHVFEPALARPDDDFDGNGPQIETYLQLRRNAGDIESRVYMHAVEWDTDNGRPRQDFTTFDGWSPWQTAYESTTGNEVLRILSPMQEHREYIDIDHADDFLTGGDLVRTYHFVGDRDGGALGGTDEPAVKIEFEDILVELASGCGGSAVPLRSHFLVPPLVNGDADFDGKGPNVAVSAFLRVSADQKHLETLVHMDALEDNLDPSATRARYVGSDWQTAYTAPDGQLITPFPLRVSTFTYADTDHQADVFAMPSGDLVDFYEFVGDTDGEDAGVRTSVRVVFNLASVNLTPAPAVNAANVRDLTPTGDVFFEPAQSREDSDFDGNGPFMETYVQLRANGAAVEARVYLLAQEWSSATETPRADYTAFDGWSGWQEIASIPGRVISRILSPMQSIKRFVDTDHLLNIESGDTLVDEFQIVGDTDGGTFGAADRPSVRVVFNDIRVELV